MTTDAEEQQTFLLRSLDDLDREHDAGDLADQDYETLRDDYVVRIAALTRRRDRPVRRRPITGRRSRALLWVTAVVAIAALAGFAMAQSSGPRRSSDLSTGDVRASATGLLADAKEAMEGRDLAGAVAGFDAVLELDPANVEALTYRAWALYLQGDVDAAADGLSDAVAADGRYPDAWAFTALVAVRRADGDAAVRALESLNALDPAPDIAAMIVPTGLEAAELLLVDGPVERVLDAYAVVLGLEPRQVVARTARGWLYSQAGLLDEALADLDIAVEEDPKFPAALAYRAITLAKADRLEEAATDLESFDALAERPADLAAEIEQSGIRDRV